MRGKSAHVHEVIDGHTLRISINSFFQSRTDGAETLARLVREATGPDRVLADLYCGVGLFAVTADPTKRESRSKLSRAAVSGASTTSSTIRAGSYAPTSASGRGQGQTS